MYTNCYNSKNKKIQFSFHLNILSLSASLIHTFTQVRAAALRTIRYVLATIADVEVFNSMQLPYLLCRSIDLKLKNDDERVQALKLVSFLFFLNNYLDAYNCIRIFFLIIPILLLLF